MAKFNEYDFSGWATKNDIRCSDGKTIRKDAFIEDDGKVVPIVWNHQHNDVENVLGHALLENRDEGVWFYGKLNDTPKGKIAKELIHSRDISSVSIYANKLKQERGNVLHGVIRELSLVLAGANPGATIEYPILQHSDGSMEEVYDEAIISGKAEIDYSGGFISHADEGEKEMPNENKASGKTVKEVFDTLTEEQKQVVYFMIGQAVDDAKGEVKHADEADEDEEEGYEDKGSGKTVKEVFDSLSEEQKQVVYFMIGQAVEDSKKGGAVAHSDDYYDEYDEGGYDTVKRNVFDNSMDEKGEVLSQSAINEIFEEARKDKKSLANTFLAHAEDYGIDGIEWLFPEDHELNNTPKWIKREPSDWVNVVMNGVSHTPFSRVRTRFADITEDEARAKGYIKGHRKKEEVFSLLKRSTSPCTIYKKQKLDRDDVNDITDFDVVAWIKGEMRMMLDEEIARAILIGDGRLPSDDDKISEDHIRPIANDADLFTIKKAVVYPQNATDSDKADAFITAAIKGRKGYRGSGNPILFTTEDHLTDMLLMKDGIGHRLYKTEAELATALRVSRIVTVSVMEGHQVGGKNLLGIVVNPKDYTVGADKGGAVSMFDDFDIDYNRMIYLIETRCSGALTVPFSALILFEAEVPTSVDGDVQRSKTTTTPGDDEGNNG